MRSVQNKPSSFGFTLLEMIVVIAILVGLAALIVPVVQDAIVDAKVAKLVALADTLKKAARKYYQDTNTLPREDDGSVPPVHDLFANTSAVANWKGPYISAPLTVRDNPFGTRIMLINNLQGPMPLGVPTGFRIAGTTVAPGSNTGCELKIVSLGWKEAAKLENLIDGSNYPLSPPDDEVTFVDNQGICESSPNQGLASSGPGAPSSPNAMVVTGRTDTHIFLFQK